MAYGQDTSLAISFQNSYGTSLTSSRYWVPFLSEGFAVAKEALVSEVMQGRFDEGATYEGLNSNEGTLEMDAHPILTGVLLKSICGAPTASVQSGSIYTHTFKPRTSDFDRFSANIPLTITKIMQDGGSAHQYYDMSATKISFSIANGDFLKTTVDFTGGKYSQVSAPATSFPTGKNWTWDSTSVSIAGAANVEMTELTVELDEAIENTHVLNGTKTPGYAKRSGFRTMNITGTMLFLTQSEYQEFISQTERQLIVTCRGPTVIQSGYYDVFKIDVPLMRYTEFKPVAEGVGQIEVSFAAKAIYSTTSATMAEFTLVNTQAAF